MADEANLNRIDALDAIRGYAIAAVLAIHCSTVIAPSSAWLTKLVNMGPRGVQLFYIASGFVMFLWLHRRPIRTTGDLRDYAAKRIGRLAPMFWLAIVFYYPLYGLHPTFWAPTGVGPLEVILTVLMVHTWWPEAANSIVPGGWSVGVEVTFYALVPLLALVIRNIWGAALALVAAAFAAYPASQSLMSLYSGTEAAKSPLLEQFADVISFPPQMPAFAGGILLYFIWRSGFRLKALSALCLLAVSLVACWMISNDTGYWFSIGIHSFVFTNPTLFMIAMVPGVAALLLCPTLPLNNRIARYIGRVSYSIYLLHIVIISGVIWTANLLAPVPSAGDGNFLVFIVATLLACVAISTVTYRFIEEPGKRLMVGLLALRAATPEPATLEASPRPAE